MEITTTTVTRTARQTTPAGIFNIEYSTINERLERVGIHILRPPLENEAESFLGTVHYDGRNISCHIVMEEDLAHLIETAVGFIAEIIESTGHNPGEDIPDNNKQR